MATLELTCAICGGPLSSSEPMEILDETDIWGAPCITSAAHRECWLDFPNSLPDATGSP